MVSDLLLFFLWIPRLPLKNTTKKLFRFEIRNCSSTYVPTISSCKQDVPRTAYHTGIIAWNGRKFPSLRALYVWTNSNPQTSILLRNPLTQEED